MSKKKNKRKSKRKMGPVDLNFGHFGDGRLYAAPVDPKSVDVFVIDNYAPGTADEDLIDESFERIDNRRARYPGESDNDGDVYVFVPPGEFWLYVNDLVYDLRWDGVQLRSVEGDRVYFDLTGAREEGAVLN